MKRIVALLMIVCLCILCGCVSTPVENPSTAGTTQSTEGSTGSQNQSSQSTAATTEPAPTTQAPTAPSTEPTAPTEPEATTPPGFQDPVYGPSDSKPYENPLTGEGLAEPYTGRVFAVSINNLKDALPHRGVYMADIYMEMFVNHSVIRGLALYSDISKVSSIGSVRSTRPVFNMLAAHFDAFMCHAGYKANSAASQTLAGIDHMNIDTGSQTAYSYRDTERESSWEHTLFAKGAGLLQTVTSKGYRVTNEAGKSYGMNFTENGTPENGDKATTLTITFRYNTSSKQTKMIYNSSGGRYIYNQYGMFMADADTNILEGFENVLVLLCKDQMDKDGYHIYDLEAGGQGYFACGGKIIPILWSCAGKDQPFVYTTTDGEPLNLGIGSSYIALAPLGSTVEY